MCCTIEGCGGEAVAKGLCAKHYMRLRRAGSADTVGKAGRPPNKWRAEVLADERRAGAGYLQRMSPRTRAKYWKWIDFMHYANDPEMVEQAMRIAAFKHHRDTANYSRLEQIAKTLGRALREDWKDILDALEKYPQFRFIICWYVQRGEPWKAMLEKWIENDAGA
jgi:hypothetical protein